MGLDTTQPMMIEGDPETRVISEGLLTHRGDLPMRVYSNGMSCMIFVKPGTGDITSQLYHTKRVINQSHHETLQAQQDAMEANTLWGAF